VHGADRGRLRTSVRIATDDLTRLARAQLADVSEARRDSLPARLLVAAGDVRCYVRQRRIRPRSVVSGHLRSAQVRSDGQKLGKSFRLARERRPPPFKRESSSPGLTTVNNGSGWVFIARTANCRRWEGLSAQCGALPGDDQEDGRAAIAGPRHEPVTHLHTPITATTMHGQTRARREV